MTPLLSTQHSRCAMDRSPRSDAVELKARICARARELGACAVRITDASQDRDAHEAMTAAFGRGDFSSWPYGPAYAQQAADPASVLAGARSVICIAFAYRTPQPQRTPLQGRVSAYAWSKDYHTRVLGALRRIAAEIDESNAQCVTAVACDTKPLAERAFAARAGLGWIGKHTNLIAPQAGSFVFLGEIVTTLELPPDPALKKSCGACVRCIRSCPTGALRGDYTIDASRCISDLTQRTDAIPRDARPLLGTWVWGCDVCQDVCPPNARAPHAAAQNEPASYEIAAPDLIALLGLKSGAFKRRFRKTAMGWRGAAVLRRNAAVALGNALDRSAVPALARSLGSDPHPLVRGHAAWALGRIGSPAALDALAAQQRLERETSVQREIAEALEPHGSGTR